MKKVTFKNRHEHSLDKLGVVAYNIGIINYKQKMRRLHPLNWILIPVLAVIAGFIAVADETVWW